MVTRYEFLLYNVGSTTPLIVVNLRKPAPDSAGTIRIALSTILVPRPAGGIPYEARIAAVGSGGGSSRSTPSNPFAFQVPCSYSVSPSARWMGSTTGSSTFSVTAPVGCGWSATSSTSWMAIANGGSGAGNGTVTFSAAANPTTTQRTGSLTIAGRTVTVTQSGGSCTYSVSPAAQSVARAGGRASFTVTAPSGCTWVTSEQTSWMSIASGASGSGTGSVSLNIAANTATSSRSTTATIAGRTVTVSQPPIGTRPAAPTGMRIASCSPYLL